MAYIHPGYRSYILVIYYVVIYMSNQKSKDHNFALVFFVVLILSVVISKSLLGLGPYVTAWGSAAVALTVAKLLK